MSSFFSLLNWLLAEQKHKLDDLCVENEKEEEKEVVLTKMHKSLRKLINKSPDK